MNDPAFLQSVLEGLPGVDTQSEAIKNAMGALTNKQESDKKDDKKKDDKKWTELGFMYFDTWIYGLHLYISTC